MKTTLIIVALVCTCFTSNLAKAQKFEHIEDSLKGNMELMIDVSDMKDTVGKFMLMVGGERFYPEVKNNILLVHKVMEEPRRALLAFYPFQKIKANPGKRLYEISAGVTDYFSFLGVPGKSKIVINNNVSNSMFVISSNEQQKYFSLLKLKENFDRKLAKENSTLLAKISGAKGKGATDSLISIYHKFYKDQFPKYYRDTILGFVRDNPDSPASLIELEEYADAPDKDLKLFTFLYNNLTDKMKALPTAKRINGVVDSENFALNDLLGKVAPVFSQKDTRGKSVSLLDFKGHVTLLEFWASWCGPCRQSNPALVKTYQKYNSRGFEILGVSLDDNRESWVKAIKDDKLPWIHVSDLKSWENSIAVLYHISAIPSNVLINDTGKIIASNLNDQQLDEYLGKLLIK